MRTTTIAFLLLACCINGLVAQDARVGKVRNLRDAYHPWVPPTTKAKWEAESQRLREQTLIAIGLYPMPQETPLKAVIHGKIERDDYSIEKVYFQSIPGHYVTGNLYRPKKIDGKIPVVLCPHGHWRNGRFYDAGDNAAKAQIKQKAEQFDSGAHFPLQARMVQLARMGCTVFHYDMVGYADSQGVDHRSGFTDLTSAKWGINVMGLQTWNSIRALDFVETLPEIDMGRIAVTGASGGGTQTFILCALDPRPAVAFPAVMVSTNMQGGCVCENAPYLRQGINNIAFAAMFAPRPLAMSGADDWTIDIETKGLPELKQVYSLYDKASFVHAKCYPQFKHNYNQVAREMMFAWFNEHLNLGLKTPIKQADFEPVAPADLSVFDEQHPVPKDIPSETATRDYLIYQAKSAYEALIPKTSDDVQAFQKFLAPAARVLLDRDSHQVEIERQVDSDESRYIIGRKGTGEKIAVAVAGDIKSKSAVVWIDEAGRDGVDAESVKKLTDAGKLVITADVFLTGKMTADGKPAASQKVEERFLGYTYGYNRTLLANRVRDVVTVLAFAKSLGAEQVDVVGTGEAGVWAGLGIAVSSTKAKRVVIEVPRGVNSSKTTGDSMMLPSATRYGGLGGLLSLAAPTELTIATSNTSALSELGTANVVNLLSGGTTTLTSTLTAKDVVARLSK
ncbi:MAG: hypothetical protein CMJ78_04190 [Planctomycetaceae bacterium]|nr:hypothetical protein [Planctomycetaceae bacterium]